jgi:hypothetical protein
LSLTAASQTLILLGGVNGYNAFFFFRDNQLNVCQVKDQKLTIYNHENGMKEFNLDPDYGQVLKVFPLQDGRILVKSSNKTEVYSTSKTTLQSNVKIHGDPFLIRLTDDNKQLEFGGKKTDALSGDDFLQPYDHIVLQDNGDKIIYSNSEIFVVPFNTKKESILFVPKAEPSSVYLPFTVTTMVKTHSVDNKYYIAWYKMGCVYLCFSSEL